VGGIRQHGYWTSTDFDLLDEGPRSPVECPDGAAFVCSRVQDVAARPRRYGEGVQVAQDLYTGALITNVDVPEFRIVLRIEEHNGVGFWRRIVATPESDVGAAAIAGECRRAGLSRKRLLSLRSPFSKSTTVKSLSPGLLLKAQAMRLPGSRARLLAGIPRSKDPVALALAGSTSVIF
jgi:hypothetical protein